MYRDIADTEKMNGNPHKHNKFIGRSSADTDTDKMLSKSFLCSVADGGKGVNVGVVEDVGDGEVGEGHSHFPLHHIHRQGGRHWAGSTPQLMDKTKCLF